MIHSLTASVERGDAIMRCIRATKAIAYVALSCLPLTCGGQQADNRHGEHIEMISPDGRYVAVIDLDAAEWILSVYRRRIVIKTQRDTPKRFRKIITRQRITSVSHDIAGVRWAPRNRHTLVFAVGGVYANARLAIWQGGKRDRTLVHGRLNEDSGEEFFQLDGVSNDGSTVYYGYGTASEDKYGAHWKSYHI